MSANSQVLPEQLANLPAASPPPGVRPNFEDPPSYKPSIIALEAVFMTLMGLAVAIRIFVRTRITKAWGWDDCKLSHYQKNFSEDHNSHDSRICLDTCIVAAVRVQLLGIKKERPFHYS